MYTAWILPWESTAIAVGPPPRPTTSVYQGPGPVTRMASGTRTATPSRRNIANADRLRGFLENPGSRPLGGVSRRGPRSALRIVPSPQLGRPSCGYEYLPPGHHANDPVSVWSFANTALTNVSPTRQANWVVRFYSGLQATWVPWARARKGLTITGTGGSPPGVDPATWQKTLNVPSREFDVRP